jgi:exodeoxyribonuclease V gamma subunit
MPEPIPLTVEEAAAFSRLDIGQLSSFFGHPAKYLLKNRLGVQLDSPEEAASDGEPFRLAGLERFIIGSQMLDQRLDGFKPREVFAALRADGRLPHGAVGEVEFQELWSEVDRFARRLEALHPTAARGAIDARWEISGFTLTAHITELSRDGCLGFRFGRLRAKDQLEIWLHHLALCQAATGVGKLESVFVGTDHTLRLKHVPDGLAVMKDLLAIYRQGLERPLCFFPNAGLEYASMLRASSSPSRALGSARSIWDGSDLHPGESADPYFQRCFESIHPLNAEFQELSRRVFDPLLEYASIERAS